MVGSAIDGKDAALSAQYIKSEIDADSIKSSKFVNLVMEKLDNYDERKNRMIRNQELREGNVIVDEVLLNTEIMIFFHIF